MAHGAVPLPCVVLPASQTRLAVLLDISHKSGQGFSIFMWLDACGNPSNYAPGGPALSFWMRWLDMESWEPEGTLATSRAEMWEGSVRGQANPLRGPGLYSGPEMHGGREACSAAGRGCSDGAETGSQSKARRAPFSPVKLPTSSAVAQGCAPAAVGWSLGSLSCGHLLPSSSSACTYLYGEVLVQERYSGVSAVGRGAMGCSMAASWL